ncbi:minor tail protein [Burkholderia phage vB_BceS_AH2]|uniref:Minor tail protein n=1 Tax=Burkholderia phage vB_BceS_AH2 TaxID=1133022 RepID=I6NP98_9CAUD|nr:tail terminator [Burkholderia phage vB_BceS_AH2]AEY69568.1 minor tail protein [Burkholderia phage vB_BceS_AH2]
MASDRPFRLRILDGITASLKRITVVNGYHFDMADSVFRGRLVFGDDDPVPLIAVNEAPLPPDPEPAKPASGAWTGEWHLMIQGWVDDDKDNPTDPAHFLMADVRKVLANERREQLKPGRGNNLFGMQGRVLDFSIGACVVRPAEEQVNELANFLLSVTLQIAEDMNDPYA